ncbi:MAG: hypothetical protein WCY41_06205 [Candidatus Micrarchaeia archaeon]
MDAMPKERPGAGAMPEESPEQRLSLLLGGALEQKVKEKIDSFGGLLSREAAVIILCQENGISAERKLPLSEARASMLPFSFSARVDRIFPVQQFPGGSFRTVRLHISDQSGEATLVLWNEQAKLAEGGIFAGDAIECSGAYARAGEISIGRGGGISRAGNGTALAVAGLKAGLCNVRGIVEKAESLRAYRDRKTGAEKSMLQFSICSGGKCCRAVWWSPPGDAPQLREGAEVVLEGASFRDGELHLNSFSRIVAGSGPGASGKAGKFLGAAVDGNEAILSIGAEKFRMPIGNALPILGVQAVPRGVAVATLLSIKARALEGKEAHYFSEGNSLASLKFEN